MFDVSAPVFDRDYRPLLSPEHISGAPGEAGRVYYARGLINAWAERKAAAALRAVEQKGGVDGAPVDPMLVGSNSPALERYRLARAKREEHAHERDLGAWIKREDVHNGFAIIAGLLRSAGENLQRLHGPEVAAVLEEALVEAEREFVTRFNAEHASGNDLAGEVEPGAATAEHG